MEPNGDRTSLLANAMAVVAVLGMIVALYAPLFIRPVG
jgi:hypothetical protein